jgi:hypothetical protein
MRSVRIYAVKDGWLYEVRLGDRVVVLGWSRTRERAQKAAETA